MKLDRITETSYNSDLGKYYEGLFTQGNGYVHVRGSFDEGLIDSNQDREYERKPANVTLEKHEYEKTKWGTYIPGVVGKHPLLMTEIINLPYFFEMKIWINDEQLDMDESKILNYSRWLNLMDGVLYRNFEYESKDGIKLKFSFSRFISKNEKHLAFQTVEIEGIEGEAKIKVEAGINCGVKTNGFEHVLERKLKQDAKGAYADIKTNGGNTVSIATRLSVEPKALLSGGTEDKRVYQATEAVIKAGEKVFFEKRIAIAADRDLNEIGTPEDRVIKYLKQAENKTLEQHYSDHAKKWDDEWSCSDIKITGNDDLQLATRMSIYHLLRAKPEDDYRVAICAKGYAGEAYFGRYFWDTEINMLPFFIHTNPKAAKNLMRFRYETLEGAKRNAKNYGYPGARYPWESSVTGEEECASWQYADHEVHVTADVVYAIMHYVKATGDYDFLKKYGIEIMAETARYWCKRVDADSNNRFHLLGVMGPDEYLPMTQDNTYTNNMVIYSLLETVKSLEWLRKEDHSCYNALTERLKLKQWEIESFELVAKNLVKGYDASSKVILQSADFMNYADLDLDKIWKDKNKCFGTFISQEKNYRSKALKQADLLELILLMRDKFTMEQLEANYDYYEPITTHDSSLSAAVHGILCSWMGRKEEASKFMEKVIGIDMSLEKKGAEEGIHIANCGGIWQLLVYGFAGVKSAMFSDKLELDPHLPDEITSMEFSLFWHGKQYCISVDKEGYEIQEA